jgi:hypothetical protein
MSDEQTRILQEILNAQREQVDLLKNIKGTMTTMGFLVITAVMLASAFINMRQ